MSVRKISLIFFAFFILFSGLNTPINLLLKLVELPKSISYQNLTGTLWQGEASVVQVDKQRLEKLSWSFKPSELLTGNLGFDIKFGNARINRELSGKAIASVGLAGTRLKNMTFRLPASLIKSALPIPVGPISGRVVFDIEEFEYQQPLCNQLVGDVSWLNAAIDISGEIAFGTISSQLSCQDNKVIASFDGANSLGIEGKATIASAKSFGFNGFLKPSAELPAVVHQGIGVFAKVDAKGRYKISL